MQRLVFQVIVLLLVMVLYTSSFSRDVVGQGPDTPGLYIHDTTNSTASDGHSRPQASSFSSATSSITVSQEPGHTCSTIDFEGIGDLDPIPKFDGITSPDWLGIIDFDAGGTGNFAFEPSPSTVAFWLGGETGTGSSRDILFEHPVSIVEFFYASAVTTNLDAFDVNGNLVATTSGPPNWNQGDGGDPNGGFNQWEPLRLEANTNEIVKITVLGAVNQTGIDNLKVCQKIGIHSIEFTQAIQEWQTLEDLKADLADNSEPPIPIVAKKPMALRVYMEAVDTATEVRVQISGIASENKTISLQPGCTPEQSRKQENNCLSADFFFTPPTGSWTVTIKIFDENNNEIESHSFTLASVDTNPLLLVPVSVCSQSIFPPLGKDCGDGNNLLKALPFLRASYPTYEVSTTDTIQSLTIPINYVGVDWWIAVATALNIRQEVFGPRNSRYHGMASRTAPGDNNLIHISGFGFGRAAASRVYSLNPEEIKGFKYSTEEWVAHENSHTLGPTHTGTKIPTNECWGTGGSDFPFDFPVDLIDWPYNDNGIQQVGFDIAQRKVFDPKETRDWMSYCNFPRWISPHTYRKLLENLRSSSSTRLQVQSEIRDSGVFWLLSGAFEDGNLSLDPLFRLEIDGPTDTRNGSHRIEILDITERILFTRLFEPFSVIYELIPVQDRATKIRVKDPDGNELASLALEGASPNVRITSPIEGEVLNGEQEIVWKVTDPDSENHTFWVHYSPDGGTTWRDISTGFNTAKLMVDFDDLPGCLNNCLMRILASDGVNTGVGISSPFTVPKKTPTAEISFPESDTVFQLGDLVWLQGVGIDEDDGFLDYSSMRWESNLEGFLGNGDALPIAILSEGTHIVTFSAIDSDGNIATDAVTVQVDGTVPALNLSVVTDGTPASCVNVTIEAADEVSGSGLDAVEYSLNAGESWNPTSLGNMPFNFIVPGQGFFHLVVRAIDKAGNLTATDQKFFIDEACNQVNTPPVTDAGGPYEGNEGETITLDASASSDPDANIILYEWDIDNDGNFDKSTGVVTTAIVFDDNDSFIVRLRVTDRFLESDTDTVEVKILNLPTSVEAGPDQIVNINDSVRLAPATFIDPGFLDTHTATVKWGDGTEKEGKVTQSPGSGTVSGSHIYTKEGNFTVEICVVDDDGGTGCDTLQVLVSANQLDQYPTYLPLIFKNIP